MITCEEFRSTMDSTLRHVPLALPAPLADHASHCRACEEYRRSVLALHAALLDIPMERLPEGLSARLKSLAPVPAQPRRSFAWMPDVKLAGMLLLPAAAMIAAGQLPPVQSTAIQFTVLTAGLTILVMNLLKPIFLGRPVQSV